MTAPESERSQACAPAGIRVIAPQFERVRGRRLRTALIGCRLRSLSAYGGRISFIADPARYRVEEPAPRDPTTPVFGPFAATAEIARHTQNRPEARVARGSQKRQRPTERG